MNNELTKIELISKYGWDVINHIDLSHCENWLELVNKYNDKTFLEDLEDTSISIPMSLECNINLTWFTYFFSKSDGSGGYLADMKGTSLPFDGNNYLDIPYPEAVEIKLWGDNTKTLPKGGGSWYDLFLIMNDLVWESERCLDICITGIELITGSDGKKFINVTWSS